MPGGFEHRRRHLAAVWTVVAFAAWSIAATNTDWHSIPWMLVIGFTSAAGWLTRWSSLETTRMEFDPSTPFIVGTAVALGPGLAPIILLFQAAVSTVTDAVAHKRHREHALINLGVISSWHLLLATLLGPMTRTVEGSQAGPARWAAWLMGLALITALSVMFNYLTVALTVTYLYGAEAARPDGAVTQNVIDISASTMVALAVWAAGDNGWMLVITALLVAVYVQHAWTQRTRKAEATALEVSAEVSAAESLGPLPGHTKRVVDVVTEIDASSRARSAAWCHGAFTGGLTHLCGGVLHDHGLLSKIRALPGFRRIERHIPLNGIPSESELSQWIAAACAWDSRRLQGSPIRAPDDLVFTLGIDRHIVDRVVDLDPGWVTDRVHRRAGRSTTP